MEYIISCDLGTGGTKSSLFTAEGKSEATVFDSCKTYYPQKNFREQKPEEWWEIVVRSIRRLLDKCTVNRNSIIAIAVSGHSLGAIPLSGSGELLIDAVPIWFDARAEVQAAKVFKKVDERNWYLKTGNGFPAALYAAFKILWYRDNMPELYKKTVKFIGTKDFLNYKLTGVIVTDYSYASGSGVYELENRKYNETMLEEIGIDRIKMPEILSSTEVIGSLTAEAADALGLLKSVKVVCGGVDNACMAAGAGCIEGGNAYTSIGTSAWIAVSSDKPIVDNAKRPYVFAHILPGMFVSATPVFSAGNSYRWVRDILCKNLSGYDEMNRLAADSPVGANRLFFNPSLAGGASLDDSVNIRGCFSGINLQHSQNDIIRAALEGVTMNLRIAMDVLAGYTTISEDMLLVGGGGKSSLWRQLFADIYNKNITESRVGEDAGSLGAAATAAVGSGLWKDFSPLKKINEIIDRRTPDAEEVEKYEKLLMVFCEIARRQSEIGELIAGLY